VPTYQEKEWNDYCKIRYNLGKHFVDIIRLYNERLSRLINEKYELLDYEETRLIYIYLYIYK